MRVGVICNDIYHPAAVVRQGIENLHVDPEEVQWEFFEETIDWPMSRFDELDTIVLSKGNSRSVEDMRPWLTDEVQQGFVDFVEGGKGLLVIHSGIVGYADQPVIRSLIGGVFVHHPAQCAVTVRFTSQSSAGDPSTEPFTVHDEHYFVETFGDDLQFFMTSGSDEGTQRAGWTRTQGRGRVCVLTPGHNLEVWLHPTYRRTIEKAFAWCAGGGAA